MTTTTNRHEISIKSVLRKLIFIWKIYLFFCFFMSIFEEGKPYSGKRKQWNNAYILEQIDNKLMWQVCCGNTFSFGFFFKFIYATYKEFPQKKKCARVFLVTCRLDWKKKFNRWFPGNETWAPYFINMANWTTECLALKIDRLSPLFIVYGIVLC